MALISIWRAHKAASSPESQDPTQSVAMSVTPRHLDDPRDVLVFHQICKDKDKQGKDRAWIRVTAHNGFSRHAINQYNKLDFGMRLFQISVMKSLTGCHGTHL